MKNFGIQVIKLAALTAFAVSVSMPAHVNAQEGAPDRSAMCAPKMDQNLALLAQLNAATDSDARMKILSDTLKPAPTNALCLAELIKTSEPEKANDYIQEIVAVLMGLGEDDLATQIINEFSSAPAAGPGGPNFGGGGNTPGENPGQLNPDDNEPPVSSPSSPL